MCFGSVRVVVPCGNGDMLVRDLIDKATLRYKKATGKVRFCLFTTCSRWLRVTFPVHESLFWKISRLIMVIFGPVRNNACLFRLLRYEVPQRVYKHDFIYLHYFMYPLLNMLVCEIYKSLWYIYHLSCKHRNHV